MLRNPEGRNRSAIRWVVAAAAVVGLGVVSTSDGSSATSAPGGTHQRSQRVPAAVARGSGSSNSFIARLSKTVQAGSTVPANGDVNPYGIAVIQSTVGRLRKRAVLVSNFNDKANVQGTGSTLVQVSPAGKVSLFAKVSTTMPMPGCPGGIGLSTALTILPGGWVVVGSVPAGPGGGLPTANPAGCLIVLNATGKVVATWSNQNINGPWDLTSSVSGSHAALFVSNSLTRPHGAKGTPNAGLCTVVRIDVTLNGAQAPKMTGSTVIGSTFPWVGNKATFVESPTGLALGRNGSLYVAETPNNTITAIPNALTRTTAIVDSTGVITSGGFLDAPLGMTLAPNGDLLVMNGNNGNIVEVTPQGRQIAKVTLLRNGAGDLFGIALAPGGHGIVFVDDGANSIATASAAA